MREAKAINVLHDMTSLSPLNFSDENEDGAIKVSWA